MNKTTIPVKLPPSLGNAARKLAEEDGVSLNQWVSLAVAQKISSVETAEAFFKRRSQGADQVDFLEILRNAPDRRPILAMNWPRRTFDSWARNGTALRWAGRRCRLRPRGRPIQPHGPRTRRSWSLRAGL